MARVPKELPTPRNRGTGICQGRPRSTPTPLIVFTTPPSFPMPLSLGTPQPEAHHRRLPDTLSVRYRNHCLRKHGRRRLIYHILRFIDNQRSIGLSLKIHGILTFAENTGVCEPRNGPRSVTEKTGVCERSPKHYPESWMWGAKQYLLLILLITADYYLLLITIILSYILIHYDGK